MLGTDSVGWRLRAGRAMSSCSHLNLPDGFLP